MNKKIRIGTWNLVLGIENSPLSRDCLSEYNPIKVVVRDIIVTGR